MAIRAGVYILILCAVGAALLAGAIGGAWEKFPPAAYASAHVEALRPGQEDSLKAAVWAQGGLWLLSDSGEIWIVREGRNDAERRLLPEPALAICVRGGRPVVATAPRNSGNGWTMRQWTGAAWATGEHIAAAGDGLVGMACGRDALTVLTSRRLISAQGSRAVAATLSNRIPAEPISTLLTTPDYLFVGQNAGEFGGGLQRIDRRTGEVRMLARNATGQLCSGPLNPDCDPVNGLAVAPWKPDCVVAAVGLVHMLAHGRLALVCGERIETIYEASCDSFAVKRLKPLASKSERLCREPFFGLVARRRDLIAVEKDGLVAVSAVGAEPVAVPALQKRGPFKVGFSRDFVVVSTTANERHSLSGATPLIVAR
jgi:hypothetical protein